MVKEFRGESVEGYESGQIITVEGLFNPGDYVDVSAKSKGKGFAGVMKRWNFSGGRASHGSMFNRAPGSIGASATPSRVFKGKKMPGQMGAKKITAQNVKVIEVRPEENLLLLEGSITGSASTILEIRKAKKKG